MKADDFDIPERALGCSRGALSPVHLNKVLLGPGGREVYLQPHRFSVRTAEGFAWVGAGNQQVPALLRLPLPWGKQGPGEPCRVHREPEERGESSAEAVLCRAPLSSRQVLAALCSRRGSAPWLLWGCGGKQGSLGISSQLGSDGDDGA